MQNEIKNLDRYVGASLKVGIALSSIAAVFVALTFWMPMQSPSDSNVPPPRSTATAPARESVDIDALASNVGGRRLVRPSQAIAAVKDNGAAAKLLTHLKLVGTTTEGEKTLAYIMVDKSDMRTVRVGDPILEFRVEEIGADGVHLILDGVAVVLKY
jgi:hypothetical protein